MKHIKEKDVEFVCGGYYGTIAIYAPIAFAELVRGFVDGYAQ